MSKLVVCAMVHGDKSDIINTIAKVDTWAEANPVRRSIAQADSKSPMTPVVYDERGNMLAKGFHRI